MTTEIFIKIVLCSAIFGWCWVDVLTPDRAIFDKIKAYYPVSFEKWTGCSMCFAARVSILVICIYYICNYNFCSVLDIPYIVLAPMATMAVVQLLKK